MLPNIQGPTFSGTGEIQRGSILHLLIYLGHLNSEGQLEGHLIA
jgi:hypothetical protein